MNMMNSLKEKKEEKAHSLQLLLRLVVTDKDGKIISDTGQKPAKSFLIQYLEFWYGAFRGVNYSCTDIYNAETPIYEGARASTSVFRLDGPVGNNLYGIVVGTNAGSTPEDNENYKLDTQILHGAGAGQLTHNACTWDAPAIVGVNVECEGKRSFTNNSGATVTVKEVGVYACGSIDVGTKRYHCIIRDVVADKDVPDLCSLTVYYTLRTCVAV